MNVREFVVHGDPRPQGDKSAVMTARGMRVIEGNNTTSREKHKNWRSAVAQAAAAQVRAFGALPAGPLQATVVFRFPMPKSRSKADRTVGYCLKEQTPDLDKLLRSLFDGLTVGGLIVDDCKIARVDAVKIEVLPPAWLGCHVRIESMTDAADRWDLESFMRKVTAR